MKKVDGGSGRAVPSLPREAKRLEQSAAPETRTTADGKVTTTRRRQGAKTEKELVTTQGRLGERSVEYRRRQSTARGQSESTFSSSRDLLGREQSSATRVSTRAAGDRRTVTTQSRDAFGIDKRSSEETRTRLLGNGHEETARIRSSDSVGNRYAGERTFRVTSDGRVTTTTTRARTSGSELTTRARATYEDGKLTWSDGAEWTRRSSVERSVARERATAFDPSGLSRRYERAANLGSRVFGRLGLEKQWQSELSPERMRTAVLASGAHGSVVAQAGVEGRQSLRVGADGVQADFNRTARAGVYARSEGQAEGRYGSASYAATGKAEAIASVDARGRLDGNGLDAVAEARVGASVEVEVSASARTRALRVGNTELSAGVDGRARAVAEAKAEAVGRARITRHPPAAILEGRAGASAVAKVEGDIRASAGPFSVRVDGHLSAGAEATATGVVGYENGKLRLGGSAAAALGVGGGVGATVELDVAQAKQMARDAADLNRDGRLDWRDGVAAAVGGVRVARRGVQVARAVAHRADVDGDGRVGLSDARAAVSRSARRVASWFGL